ncbi:hypothetical protein OSTOST_04162, partial [Ostertagia ostertagi]
MVQSFDGIYSLPNKNFVLSAHLLSHKGEGSLLSELKRLGWVRNLYADADIFAKGTCIFQVDVHLSADGLDHTEDIVSLVFKYIGLIRRSGVVAWIHEELRDLGELHFRFVDKQYPKDVVVQYSSELQRIPFQDVLSCRILLTEYNP